MYNPGMTISAGAIGYPANGTIEVVDISTPGNPKTVLCNITTPWGDYYDLVPIDEGECTRYIKYLSNPFREYIYIIKPSNIDQINRTATFKVLSYAHDDSILKSQGGANQLALDSNLPQYAQPGSTINYDFKITNSSSNTINIRHILATHLDDTNYPVIDNCISVPPTPYTIEDYWYDNWAQSEQNLAPGAYTNITGSTTMPQSGTLAFRLGAFTYVENYWSVGKHEYVAPAGWQGGYLKHVEPDLCAGVTCDNICVGNDLYSQVCDPATGQCVQDTLIESNSPLCVSSHYVEYDISFLPQDFLDAISSAITEISDTLGTYLPLPDNIEYVQSELSNGKFRIYVNYTPPLSAISQLHEHIDHVRVDMMWPTEVVHNDQYSNLYSNPSSSIYSNSYENPEYIETLAMVPLSRTQRLQIFQTLETFAQILAGILIFILSFRVLYIFGWWGVVAAAVVGAVGAMALSWIIHNSTTAETTSHSTSTIPPDQKIQTIRDFSNQARDKCKELYPTCASDPPTCSVEDMKGYNKCIGAIDLAQMEHDDTQTGIFDPTKYDDLKSRIDAIDACLNDASCTVSEAKTNIDNRSADVNNNSEQDQQMTTCDTGYTYDPEQQKCIKIEDCTIRNPFGGCILEKGAAQSIMMIGALALVGYVSYKVVTKPK